MVIDIRKRRFLFLFAVFSVFLPCVVFAGAVGTLTAVEGNVDILRPESASVVPVRTGDQVFTGDVVRTKWNGKVEIQFVDESVVQLAPESRMRIDDYTVGANKVRESGFLSLFRGKIRALVSKARTAATQVGNSGTNSNFNIKTRTAIAGVRGTGLIVFYERGVSGVIFTEGHGFVYNPAVPDRIVPMSRGQVSLVTSGSNAPTDPKPVTAAAFAAQLQQTTVGQSGQSGNSGGQTDSHSQTSSGIVTVVSENSLMTGFTVDTAGSAGGAPQVTMLTSPTPPIIPITETDRHLLPTPVTVRTAIPR